MSSTIKLHEKQLVFVGTLSPYFTSDVGKVELINLEMEKRL